MVAWCFAQTLSFPLNDYDSINERNLSHFIISNKGLKSQAWNHLLYTNYQLLKQANTQQMGSLIGNTQFGNFMIFMPLRFYKEINFGHCEAPKMPFWPFEQLWILSLWEFLTFSSIRLQKNQNSMPPKLLNGSFWPCEMSQT